MANAKICIIEDCGNKSIARNLCGKHYQRWRKAAPDSEVCHRARPGEPEAWINMARKYSGNDCLLWPYGKYSSGYGMFNLPSGGPLWHLDTCANWLMVLRHTKAITPPTIAGVGQTDA